MFMMRSRQSVMEMQVISSDADPIIALKTSAFGFMLHSQWANFSKGCFQPVTEPSGPRTSGLSQWPPWSTSLEIWFNNASLDVSDSPTPLLKLCTSVWNIFLLNPTSSMLSASREKVNYSLFCFPSIDFLFLLYLSWIFFLKIISAHPVPSSDLLLRKYQMLPSEECSKIGLGSWGFGIVLLKKIEWTPEVYRAWQVFWLMLEARLLWKTLCWVGKL